MEYIKITVVNDDNLLALDGVGYLNLDFTNVPDEIHALQWNGVKGEIEFYPDDEGVKPPNQKINKLPEWIDPLILLWEIAKEEDERSKAKIAAQLAAQEAIAEKIKNPIIEAPSKITVNPNGN